MDLPPPAPGLAPPPPIAPVVPSKTRHALRIATLPWIAGAYFLVLGTSLLILSPGTPIVPVGLPWLRGAVTAASGLILLWLAGVAAPRSVVCGLYVLVALPQLAFGLQFIRQGTYAPGATLVWFALGLLVTAGIHWHRGEVALSIPAVESPGSSATNSDRASSMPPDLAGFVLAGSEFTQGLDILLQPTAAASLPQPLAQTLTVLGVLFVAGGIILALAQLLTRLPLGLRWAAHVFAGLILLSTWVIFSANGDLGLWLRGSSLLLTGVTVALLPFIGSRAAQLDRRSFYSRLALALITATTLPLLVGMTAMVSSSSTVITPAGRQVAFSVTILTVAFCAAAGGWLAARLARPLEVVVRGAARFAAGDRDVRLVVYDSPTEIVRLAGAVRDMADSLDARAAQQAQQAQEAAVLEERQRLARDLHDSVSQTLAAIGMSAHSALANWESKPALARDRVRLAGSMARRAQAEMRALIFELRPDQLQVDGLVQALQLQAAALAERQEFAIEVSLGQEPVIPVAVKEVFYRVAQEAMHNAAKHARPARLELTLVSGDKDVTLFVKDDGNGFDPAANYPGHLGLRSMRERAAGIGADLAIESAPGETYVRLYYLKAADGMRTFVQEPR